MAIAVLDNTILMLTLYIAALIFSLQHVADRYTPHLIWPILRRWILFPLISLFTAIVGAGISAISSNPVSWPLLVSLLWNIVTVIVFCYILWRLIANPWELLKLARKERSFVDALEEILLKAIQRDDRLTITLAFSSTTLEGNSKAEEEEILDWFADHTDLLTSEWLANLLLRHLFKSNYGLRALESRTKLLHAMLIQALNDESESRAMAVLYFVLSRLKNAEPWEATQGNLLAEIGVPLWRVGEWVASVSRVWHIDAQLRGMQGYYIESVREMAAHVKALHSSTSTEELSKTLAKLIEETHGLEFIEILYSLITDKTTFLLLTVKEVEELREALIRPLTKITEVLKDVEELRKTLPAPIPLTDKEKMYSEVQQKLEYLINAINTMSVGGRIPKQPIMQEDS